jgi:hypothetical protein
MPVYFIRCVSSGLIKIGHTGDINKRFTALQTGSASRLELVGTIDTADDAAEERRLHVELAAHRAHGEWFRPVQAVTDIIPIPKHPATGEPQPEPPKYMPGKVGRPSIGDTPTERVDVRVDAARRKRWQQAAERSDMNLSDWIRNAADAAEKER